MERGFALVALATLLTGNVWGQTSKSPAASASTPDPPTTQAAGPRPELFAPAKRDSQGDYSPGVLLRNLAGDQKAIWTSPARLHASDLGWLVPLAGVGAGLLATDSDTSRNLSNSRNTLNRSTQISNIGVGALGGAAAGMYLWGKLKHNQHEEETGFLASEAALNSLAVAEALKFATGRERPYQDSARGQFRQGGSSFPSEHATAAWAIASVVAHEYPGLLTKILAYGLAGAVSASRVTAKQHFPSDVFFGSAIGWFVGEEVYRAHHDPEVGGGVWNTFAETHDGEGQPAGSRASAFVPLDSWVYPAIERLAAEGYVRTAMLGMRPWTRTECARLIGEAEDSLNAKENDPPGEVARTVSALEREFAGELGSGAGSGLELTSLYTRVMGISGPPLTSGYYFGQTVVNDNGRPYGEGTNVASGFTAQALAGPFVAYVNGEFQHAPGAGALPEAARAAIASRDLLPAMPPLATPPTNRFDLVEGYVGMALGNWQITAGKQALWWGPGEGSAMMWTDNAEPVEMLRFTRVSPFKLPSIFGLMGPIRTEFFVGRLGGYQFIFHQPPVGLLGRWGVPLADQPMIHGEKFSFKPSPNLEFGFDRTTIFGGAGYPVTWDTFLRSVFSTSNTIGGAPNKPGKRLSGFDMNYRLPGLRNWVTFYADSLAYDEFTPVAYFDRSANSAGLYFPRLPKLNRWDLRIEGLYTDNPISSHTSGNLCCGFYYSNDTWRTGYRNDGNLIASWVGRDGQGFEGWLGRSIRDQGRLEFSYRHQKVSGQFIPGGGTVNDGGIATNLWLRPNLSVSASVQYEQWTFPVLAAGAQTNVTAAVQLTFWPRWRVR